MSIYDVFSGGNRPFDKEERLFDPCRRRCHYLRKGNLDSYHRLR